MTTSLLDEHRALEPPDPISNSEVKRRIADGSVGFPHVRVGHRQAPKKTKNPQSNGCGFFYACSKKICWKRKVVADGTAYRALHASI